MMTDKEYANHYGMRCPFCTSHEIESKGVMEYDNGVAWQDVGCRKCGKEWQDIYHLTGFEPQS